MMVLKLPYAALAVLLPLLAAPSRAADGGNATAYSAIRVVRGALGENSTANLVEVSGRDGVPQPYLWTVVLKEAKGTKEIDVAGGKVVAQRTLARPPISNGIIKLGELNLDSSGAFAAADAQARKVQVRFDSMNYTLRADAKTGKTGWGLELFNQDGAGVGTMRLTATDGTVETIGGRLADGPGRPGQPVTAATAAASSRAAATTTTMTTTTHVETTSRRSLPPPPPPRRPVYHEVAPPPPVHDVQEVRTVQTANDEPQGGFFTRAGRTLDHTHDNVQQSFYRANDNVRDSFRRAGNSVKRFFTGQTNAPDDNATR